MYPAATQQLLHHRPPKFIVMQSNDTMYQVSETFILDAHANEPSLYKQAKIEQQFPELFPPTFKVGDQINFRARNQYECGYLIASVAEGLINIIKISSGIRWSEPIRVKSGLCITIAEMKQLLGYGVDMNSIEKL